MKKFTMFACLALALVFALSSFAGVTPVPSKGPSTIYGAGVNFAKAGGDTINLMAPDNDPTNTAGEPIYRGGFEDAAGDPSWEGWTHTDLTAPTTHHWQVSDYNQTGGNLAAWCGSIDFDVCIGDPQVDVVGGYGHGYNDLIKFRAEMPNTASSTTVTITATVQYDSELGWDESYLTAKINNADANNLYIWSGTGVEAVNTSITYLPGDYIDGNQIYLMFRFKSDTNTDDEDCGWAGAGGVQIDDVVIGVTNGGYTNSWTEDFEGAGALSIEDPDDLPENLEKWVIGFPDGVGDFAQLWTGLEDFDPCRTNYSAQVAFIDDGLIVPGTGGSDCDTWCYGPGGYIVNTTGGLAGPDSGIDNQIFSPVMNWPNPTYDGCIFTFTVYRHELLNDDSPGIFYYWAVRSSAPGDDINSAGWDYAPYIYYGGPNYHSNAGADVTDKMTPGRDKLQVSLGAFELVGYVVGNNGTPAPYFDNVRVKVYPFIGPAMAVREIDLANSNFPARGTIDTGDLGSHSIRFDAAVNISADAHLRNDPGDSVTVSIKPVREGAEFVGVPTLYYSMQRNTLFDTYRDPAYPAVGSEPGGPAVGSTGSVGIDMWAFDLPDTGFLFPGDVLHYYIKAVDAIGGTEVQETLLPGNIDGFGDFSDPIAYNTTFTIRGLPSIVPDGAGYIQPPVLFINDFGNRGGENEWYFAFNNIGLLPGVDYDIYHVCGPSSGVGNGIGGRANALMLNGDASMPGYQEILYTAGDLGAYSISNGDYDGDPSFDVDTFKNWLDSGGKDLFVTGDEVASYLAGSGTGALALAEDYFGVTVVSNDVNPLIGNQTTPLVVATDTNPVFDGVLQSWIAYGGCLAINSFDAVNLFGTGYKLADFTDSSGNVPPYSYSAATLNIMNPGVDQSRVISLPYDFMYVHTDPDGTPDPDGLSGRAAMLRDVLKYFGIVGDSGNVSAVLPGLAFEMGNFPNPFNPSTTIKYSMPKAGHLSLLVYNVRGQLVKTLINGERPAGADQSIVWDGTNNQGSSVSSGVYFYEARTNGEVRVEKMALVK